MVVLNETQCGLVCLLQEWQDGHFLERADSGAIAAVHDAALVHVLVSHGCALTEVACKRPLLKLKGYLKHSTHSPSASLYDWYCGCM